MKFLSYSLWLFLGLLFLHNTSKAQEKTEKSAEIKLSGYLQMQYQKAQSAGISSFSSGDFDKNSDERFMIRRGRIKVERIDKFSNMTIQLDGTQNGVQIMDAFIEVTEPSKRQFAFTAGLFNRPFGYAIAYSSGDRNYPERPRVYQTIMPRERDLGAMISYIPTGKLNFLRADLALMNGTGISARDFDSKKDLMGGLTFSFDSLANNKFDLGFGASFYEGYVRNNTQTIFRSTPGQYLADVSVDNEGAYGERDYIGAHVQLVFNNSFGKTSFKTEFVKGTQPGVEGTDDIKGPASSMSFNKQPATSLYVRPFIGYYFWLEQTLGRSNVTAIASYDVYDANTDVSGNQIGRASSNTSSGDIKYDTFGYGLAYNVNRQVKITLYNEHVKNEHTLLPNYTNDLKDNVFTARVQYRW